MTVASARRSPIIRDEPTWRPTATPSRPIPRGARTMIRSARCYVAWSGVAVFLVGSAARADDKIDFNRDIRPILSDKCFACHGPDTSKLKAKLRLDVRDVAIKRGAI